MATRRCSTPRAAIEEYVTGEMLATTVEYDVGLGQPAEIDGRKLQIYVERTQAGPAG